MRKTCILITCDYPYDTGESFIENEMPFLSRSFEKIYIFPINAHEGDKQTRVPPENAEIYPVGCLHNIWRIPKYIGNGLISRHKDLKIYAGSIKRCAVNLYARGRSEYIKNYILKIIKDKMVDCNYATIYSYWFTDQAIAAWKLKEALGEKYAGIKAVCRAHGYDLYWERNSAGYLPYQDITLSKLDRVFPCSDNGRDYLIDKYPQYAGKVHTSHLGTFDFGLAPIPKGKVFVTCCSLKPIKRISLFAEAFCKVVKDNVDCYWYCIGDGEEFDLIKSIVEKNKAEANVKMVGRLSNKDVLEFYKEKPVSYFVNVSTTEGLPVSIMEAMSFGIPTIATNVGGTGELVNESNGVILDSCISVDDLAQAIRAELKLGENEYQRKRNNAREVWEKICSANKNYTEWCTMLAN